MLILIIFSIICNLAPMAILPVFYETIPNSIPAFVDFFGNTIVSMEKSYISILRLPLMGLTLSFLCIVMYSIKISEENEKFNKIIWSVAAFIGALKMGITSMEILFYENMELVQRFRLIIMVMVILGIIVLLYGLYKMYKNKIQLSDYKTGVINNRIKIIVTLCLYVALVLMPVYLK